MNRDISRAVRRTRRYVACLFQALWVAAAWGPVSACDDAPHDRAIASRPAPAPQPTTTPADCIATSLVSIHWPIAESYRRLYPDRAAFLQPPTDTGPTAGTEAVLVYAGGMVQALEPRTGRTMWRQPVASRTQPRLLGTTTGRYILATPHRVLAVEMVSGRLAWQYGEEPPLDAGTDPESVAAWVACGLTARQAYLLDNRGNLTCLNSDDGSLRWRQEGAGRSSSHLAVSRGNVTITTMNGDQSVLAVRDAASGDLRHRIPIDETTPISKLLPTDDETQLVIQSRTVTALWPASGRIRCRIKTGRRFAASTIQAADDNLYISDDGSTISKYRLVDGQRVWTTSPWQKGTGTSRQAVFDRARRARLGASPLLPRAATPSVGREASGGLWTAINAGTLYAASDEAIVAFDAHDGRRLWQRANPAGIRVQTPQLTRDAIVLVSQAEAPPAPSTAPGVSIAPPRYLIRRLDRRTGRELPVTADGPLVTDPLPNFGGVFLYDDALVVLDGGRLIGYVAQAGADRSRVPEGANMAGSVHLDCFVEPGFGENAYVIWVNEKGACWIVDPGPPPSAAQVIEHVEKHGLRPEAVLVTHGHIDHITGLPEVLAVHKDVPVYIAAAERAALTDPDENLSSALGMRFTTKIVETRDLPPGGEMVLDGAKWQILDTAGHSPGGRSFYCLAAKTVIVGDALFQMSIGRVDFHHSDGERLLNNIREHLFTLPDDTRVLCGHGPNTTIGEEKQFNPFLQ